MTIQGSLADVWRFAGDPEMVPRWNPRFLRVTRASLHGPGEGSRYRVTVRFGGRESTSDLEIVSWEPMERMTTRMSGGRLASGRFVTETWTLEEIAPRQVRLTQQVDLSRSGIPRVWRGLLNALHRIGRPVGTPYLQILRELIEIGASRAERHTGSL